MMTSTRTTASAKALAATALALALALAVATLTSCNSETGGTPAPAPPTSTSTTSSATTTTTAAQTPGLRRNAPGPTITVIEKAKGTVNAVMAQAISDAQGYWSANDPQFIPRTQFVALTDPAPGNCYETLYVASACAAGIIWETPEMTDVQSAGGDLGVLAIASHEVGHLVESDHLPPGSTAAETSEDFADCAAGVYLQTVVNGTSARFVGTRAEVESAAQSAFAEIRRGPESRPLTDRMAALRMGLDNDAAKCFDKYSS